jgi:hypothetical protein
MLSNKYYIMSGKIFAVVIFIFALTSFTHAQEVYRSEDNAFMITFPAGWTAEQGTPPVDVIARSAENPVTSVNIIVRESPAFENLTIETAVDEKFKNSIIEQYSAQFTNFVLIDNGFTDVSSYRAFYIKYTADNSVGTGRLLAIQYFLINSSKLYVISTGSPEADYSLNESMFNEIVSSFKFIL